MKITRIIRSAEYVVAAFILADGARAADILLQTGGEGALVTATRALDPITGPSWVQFNFGLATAEELLSGSFLDSVSFTLQGSLPSATTIIATLDRVGLTLAPTVPGGISLDPTSITWMEISFPDLNPELSYRRAYSVIAPVPQELFGQPLTFFVDLFDNQNGVLSVAYATTPSVVVPEPATALLAFVGCLLVFGFKWRNK